MMSIGAIFVIFICIIGIGPMLLALPLNGLTIWGQILELLNKDNQAIFVWFLLTSTLIVILLVKKLIKKRSFTIKHFKIASRLFGPWLIFCIYLMINLLLFSFNTGYKDYAIKKIMLFMVKGIIPALYIYIWLLQSKKNTIKKIENAIWAYGIIESYYVLHTYLSGVSFRRMTLFGSNPIWLARDLGLAILASLNIFKTKFVKIAIVFLLVIGITLTKSRGPLLALIITFLMMYSYKLSKSKRYKQLTPIIITIMIIVMYLVSNFGLDDYFARGGANVLEEGNVKSRIDLYIFAWRGFVESPILGKGIGSFRYLSNTYPHNIILELLQETGLIGLVLFVFALKPKNMLKFENKASIYMLFAFVTSMFSGDLEMNAYLVVFSILSNLESEFKKDYISDL